MFYVYIMLDQRTEGIWKYNDVTFNYKPFYVGIGRKYRMTSHFTPFNLKRKSIKNNIIKSIYRDICEYPIHYKIFSNLSKDEDMEIETNIIKHFGKIKNHTGILSNLTDGGDGINGFQHTENYKNKLKKKVYQYDLEGVFINEWESLKSVISFYQLSGGGGVRKSIKYGFHCHGYLWSYDKLDNLPKHKNRNPPIYQYSIYKNNTLIKTFHNEDEISDFFNRKVSRGNISMCCNKKIKTYLSFVWEKELM